ncbi:hypothetical protein ABK040_008218 [Willaertia magna]
MSEIWDILFGGEPPTTNNEISINNNSEKQPEEKKVENIIEDKQQLSTDNSIITNNQKVNSIPKIQSKIKLNPPPIKNNNTIQNGQETVQSAPKQIVNDFINKTGSAIKKQQFKQTTLSSKSVQSNIYELPSNYHEPFPVSDFIHVQHIPAIEHKIEGSTYKFKHKYTIICNILSDLKRAYPINISNIKNKSFQFTSKAFPRHLNLKSKVNTISYHHLIDSFELSNDQWYLIRVKGENMNILCINEIETPNENIIDLETTITQICHLKRNKESYFQYEGELIACKCNNEVVILRFLNNEIEIIERKQFDEIVLDISWQQYPIYNVRQLVILLFGENIIIWHSTRGFINQTHLSFLGNQNPKNTYYRNTCSFSSNPMELFLTTMNGLYKYDTREKSSKLIHETTISSFTRNFDNIFHYAIAHDTYLSIFDERMNKELLVYDVGNDDGLSEMLFYKLDTGANIIMGYNYNTRAIYGFPYSCSIVTKQKAQKSWNIVESQFVSGLIANGLQVEFDSFHDTSVFVSPSLKLQELPPHYLVGCTLIPPRNSKVYSLYQISDSGDVFAQLFNIERGMEKFKEQTNRIIFQDCVFSFEKSLNWDKENYPSLFEDRAYCKVLMDFHENRKDKVQKTIPISNYDPLIEDNQMVEKENILEEHAEEIEEFLKKQDKMSPVIALSDIQKQIIGIVSNYVSPSTLDTFLQTRFVERWKIDNMIFYSKYNKGFRLFTGFEMEIEDVVKDVNQDIKEDVKEKIESDSDDEEQDGISETNTKKEKEASSILFGDVSDEEEEEEERQEDEEKDFFILDSQVQRDLTVSVDMDQMMANINNWTDA